MEWVKDDNMQFWDSRVAARKAANDDQQTAHEAEMQKGVERMCRKKRNASSDSDSSVDEPDLVKEVKKTWKRLTITARTQSEYVRVPGPVVSSTK